MANLLLVDDDPVLLALLGKLLRRQGHAVTEVGGGPSALALAEARPFDLIITDLMMPGMDGYALTRALRATPANAHSLVLLVTSCLEGPDAATALAAGANAWACKPLNAERLADLTNQLLAGGERPLLRMQAEGL